MPADDGRKKMSKLRECTRAQSTYPAPYRNNQLDRKEALVGAILAFIDRWPEDA
jgi:hypothetical protein